MSEKLSIAKNIALAGLLLTAQKAQTFSIVDTLPLASYLTSWACNELKISKNTAASHFVNNQLDIKSYNVETYICEKGQCLSSGNKYTIQTTDPFKAIEATHEFIKNHQSKTKSAYIMVTLTLKNPIKHKPTARSNFRKMFVFHKKHDYGTIIKMQPVRAKTNHPKVINRTLKKLLLA